MIRWGRNPLEPMEQSVGSSEIEPLESDLVSGLSHPSAYALDPTANGVSAQQTHISHVFLTGSRVYKLRKAVDLGFLNFGTRRLRNEDCLREVTLNRRFAPDVYLGVAPVRVNPAGAHVGPLGDALSDSDLEHCVVMRRLPEGRDALSLVDSGSFSDRHVDVIAHALARFHRTQALGTPAPFSPGEWLTAISTPVEDNFAPLDGMFDDGRLASLASSARQFLLTHSDRFEVRRRAGRAVEGHGDAHLGHIWFEADGSDPLFVDCIEFSDQLRRIDAASEVAFLAMDLTYRGHSDLSERLLRRYATESDDFHLYAVVDYFMSYRAAVRAKVAAIAAAEPEIPDAQRRAAADSASRHLDLAIERFQSSGRGGLVLTTGIVGTGKSTAADAVVETFGRAAVVSSDRLRKALAGLDALERVSTPIDSGIYSEANTRRVYAGLLERAQGVISSGRVAVLDAAFSRSDTRSAAIQFAHRRGVPCLLVETRCREEIALRRLAERAQAGGDPSDAGPSFYATGADRFAPVDPLALGVAHIALDTEFPSWREELARGLQAWQAEW